MKYKLIELNVKSTLYIIFGGFGSLIMATKFPMAYGSLCALILGMLLGGYVYNANTPNTEGKNK